MKLIGMQMIINTIITRTEKTLFIFFLLIFISCFVARAQQLSIIPIPVSQQIGSGNFELTSSTIIAAPTKQPDLQKIAGYLLEKLKPATGIVLKISDASSSNSTIQFALDLFLEACKTF